ncbi:dynein light chain Tctex-type 1-like [Paramacrobiotus metropolitanus]|uniref:dynein light chain Tctex-type 1-like n=1 Tax=Paramacrobiotus metropolitanus TaxID=2943436 RepID=UPI002445AC80|nr:dynein light chain Tctex-type 1-like [Paramacrobiotus metropolitanus]
MAEAPPVIVQPDAASETALDANHGTATNASESAVTVQPAASHDGPSDNAAEGARGGGQDAAATSEGDATEGEAGAEQATAQTKKKKSEPRIIVPFNAEEMDELIKQAFTLVEKECEKEEYDNGRVKVWRSLVEDYLVRKVMGLERPFKYCFYVSVMQNSGDGGNVVLGGYCQPDVDGFTSGHWENESVLVDVVVVAFSVQ